MNFKNLENLDKKTKIFPSLKNICKNSEFIAKDIIGPYFKVDPSVNHLHYAMEWLKYAQDINNDGGVSAGYSLILGWLPSYPETTGYIIPTFLDYYKLGGDKDYLNRAQYMANWLISNQLESGAFLDGIFYGQRKPQVFDTGQALQGLTKIYNETYKKEYIEAAKLAADWLVETQDSDGAWRTYAYNGIPHAYYTRVAWPLLNMYKLTNESSYLDAAMKNLTWTLNQQKLNYWFNNNSFDLRSHPFLHNIAYTIEGIIECALLINESNWLKSALEPAKILLKEYLTKGYLSGRYNENWIGTANYRCITGEAQMSICWLKLFEVTEDTDYLNGAIHMNNNMKRLQNITTKNRGVMGGIKGSHPIWGAYSFLKYPNWSTKFFADALILEKRCDFK